MTIRYRLLYGYVVLGAVTVAFGLALAWLCFSLGRSLSPL